MKTAKLNKGSLRLQLPLFTFIRFLTSTAFRMVYPFLPAFRDGLGVSVASLSKAISARSLVSGLLGPFSAAIGDSRGRKTGMLLGMGLFSLGSLAVVIWPTFAGFTLAMILTILGKVTFDPSMQAYLGDRVPYERRSLVLTLTEFSWSGAYLLGMPAIGWVIAHFGWIAPFPLLGGLVLLNAVAIAFVLPRDPVRAVQAPRLSAHFKLILTTPAAVFGLIYTIFSCLSNEIINVTFGVWMEDSFGLQIAALGAAAAILGMAELGGEGLVARFTDRLGKRRAIFLGLLVNCLALMLLPLTAAALPLALAGLFLFYISFEFTIVSSIPLMTELMVAARATMMAAFFTSAAMGRAVGSWIAPWLYEQGFIVIIVVAVAANLVAILVLRGLRLHGE